ncbi:uncharacterized protein LOC116434801 isoform X2 [Nomia melanderi]|uniref:uncharacterized protein LOC116434801 isoform X2 n=1 Tax=Nomia melanderi TaxID=2448451 RepID=UPI003FCCD47C
MLQPRFRGYVQLTHGAKLRRQRLTGRTSGFDSFQRQTTEPLQDSLSMSVILSCYRMNVDVNLKLRNQEHFRQRVNTTTRWIKTTIPDFIFPVIQQTTCFSGKKRQFNWFQYGAQSMQKRLG